LNYEEAIAALLHETDPVIPGEGRWVSDDSQEFALCPSCVDYHGLTTDDPDPQYTIIVDHPLVEGDPCGLCESMGNQETTVNRFTSAFTSADNRQSRWLEFTEPSLYDNSARVLDAWKVILDSSEWGREPQQFRDAVEHLYTQAILEQSTSAARGHMTMG